MVRTALSALLIVAALPAQAEWRLEYANTEILSQWGGGLSGGGFAVSSLEVCQKLAADLHTTLGISPLDNNWSETRQFRAACLNTDTGDFHDVSPYPDAE